MLKYIHDRKEKDTGRKTETEKKTEGKSERRTRDDKTRDETGKRTKQASEGHAEMKKTHKTLKKRETEMSMKEGQHEGEKGVRKLKTMKKAH